MKDVKQKDKLAASEIVIKDADSGKLESLPLAASHAGKEEQNKTGELTSQVLKTGNPFTILTTYNPADQSTDILIEVNRMIGASFKEYFRQFQNPWLRRSFGISLGALSKIMRRCTNSPTLGWHSPTMLLIDNPVSVVSFLLSLRTGGLYARASSSRSLALARGSLAGPPELEVLHAQFGFGVQPLC